MFVKTTFKRLGPYILWLFDLSDWYWPTIILTENRWSETGAKFWHVFFGPLHVRFGRERAK